MKRGLVFTLLVILFISIFFISAEFDKGDESHEITTIYGPGDNLQGWINISLDEEPTNSLFEDNRNNEISLINLLRSDSSLIEEVDYNCSVLGCGTIYDITDSGSTSKTFSLNTGEEKIIGFKLEGDIVDITNISFSITSDVDTSCINQLEIDFFVDGEIDYINDKKGTVGCGESYKFYECFNKSKSTKKVKMRGDGEMYCQKIKLSKSPGFKLGAGLKIVGGAKKTNMSLYDIEDSDFSQQLATCELSNSTIDGEVSCEIEYLVKKSKEYYVCIFSEEEKDDFTELKYYRDEEEGCGFFRSNSGNGPEEFAYYIFAEAIKFGQIGTINITDEYLPDTKLSEEFYNYIYNTYEGSSSYIDCPSEGCIIPIKFKSKVNQEIIIKDLSMDYDFSGGGAKEGNIYNLSLTSADVTSDFIIISLNNANFSLPTKINDYKYTLDLDGSEIFEEKIYIEKVPNIKSIIPSRTFSLIPFNYKVNVDLIDNASIVSYVWKFGNATSKTTTTNQITHEFTEEGNIPVTITVTDTNGKKGIKTFTVRVDSYLQYYIERSEEVGNNLLNIESQINNFSDFHKDGINKTIDIQGIRRQLTALDTRFEDAIGDETALKLVVSDFLTLESKVPESVIEKIKTDFVSFYPDINNIEMGIIKEVLGGNYDTTKTSAYRDAVLNWNVGNVNSKVKYDQITSEFEDGRSDPILSVFELDLTKIGSSSGTIFIKELENIKFDKAYGEKLKSGYVYIPLDSSKKIKFYTTQDIGVLNLPVFVSPAISELSIIEEVSPAEEQRMRWVLFFLIMFFLLIVAVIVYIILQQWYKHKYETYLFKNRNFLFNLINYIDAQKKKGVKEGEIFRKLKKSGWTSEQINYVMRKYLGKRTGMLEIPVEKILKLFRKKSQETGVPTAPGPAGFRPGFQFRPRP